MPLDLAGSDSLFKELSDQVNEDWNDMVEWRQHARRAYRYMHGRQWELEEERALKKANREWFTFNRIGPLIRWIAGEEIKNRREVKYRARSMDKGGVNEVYSAGAEFFRDEGGAERKESLALQDCLICGLGYVEDRVDFMDDPEGTIVFERLDPFEVIPDRNATDDNLKDARRISRAKRMTLDEAREFFPDFRDEQLNATWYLGKDYDPEQGENGLADTDDDKEQGDSNLDGSSMVTIVEVQYWARERMVRFANASTGQMIEMRADAFDALAKRLGAGGPQIFQPYMKRVYYRAFLGKEILEHEKSPCQEGFSIKPITGYRDRMEGVWYGIVEPLIDPQRFTNRLITMSDHIVKTNAKGGVIYEKNLTGDPQEFEDQYAAADTAIGVDKLYNQQGAPMVIPKPATAFPPAIQFLQEVTGAAFDQVSGLNAESRGQADVMVPASLAFQRRQTAMTVLQDIFDSFRAFRFAQGYTLLYSMNQYLADGRLIRLVGDAYGRYMPLVKQPDTVRFDVVIDDAPSNPNEKERVWPIIQEMLKLFGDKVPPQILVMTLDYLPLPQSMIDKAKELLAQAEPDPKEKQLKQQAAAIALEHTIADSQLSLIEKQARIRDIMAGVAKTEAETRDIALQSAPEAMADKAQAELDMARAAALGAAQKTAGIEQRNRIEAAKGQVDVAERLQRMLTPKPPPGGAANGRAQ